MIWASTRIKKNAAAAFERESIETNEYSLVKPDGFLHPLNDEGDRLFYAYSKDFGKGDADAERQAEIEVIAGPGGALKAAADEVKAGADVLSEEAFRTGTMNVRTLDVTRAENDITRRELHKLVQANDKVYMLRFAVLEDLYDDFARRASETLDSFDVK